MHNAVGILSLCVTTRPCTALTGFEAGGVNGMGPFTNALLLANCPTCVIVKGPESGEEDACVNSIPTIDIQNAAFCKGSDKRWSACRTSAY